MTRKETLRKKVGLGKPGHKILTELLQSESIAFEVKTLETLALKLKREGMVCCIIELSHIRRTFNF